MTLGVVIALLVRCLLVILFLPFSALDKIVGFRGAVGQARQIAPNGVLATLLILGGLGVEVFMSLAIITGVADRAAALVLSGYCMITALLWKQFWIPGDFWRPGESTGRNLFWDFLKNFSLAGGFLLVTFGVTASSADQFIRHPLASSAPYATSEIGARP